MSDNPEVPDAVKAEIDEGQRLRGWIANSYAQIEYLLGDLIFRCRAFSEYNLHTKTMPHDANSRVKKIRAILRACGPLDLFAESLTIILDRFEQGHETRNLLVHGFCTYLRTPSGDTALQFEKWHRQPSQDDVSRRDDVRLKRQFRLSTMRNEMDSFVELADDAVRLIREIHQHFGWTGLHST